MERIALTSSPDGYFLFDAVRDVAIGLSWASLSPEGFIGEDSLPDGSWAIEVYRVAETAEASFHVYWLYPFSHRVHRWIVDAQGERIDGQDLSPEETRWFLLQRLDESPTFLARWFLFLSETDQVRNDPALVARVASLAVHAGVEDALYCVCAYPRYFRPDLVEQANAIILQRLSLMRAVRQPPGKRTALSHARLVAFCTAAAQNASARLTDFQLQAELASDLRAVLNTSSAPDAAPYIARMGHIVMHRVSQLEMGAVCAPIANPELVFRVEFSPSGIGQVVVTRSLSAGMPHTRLLICIGFMHRILQQNIGRPQYVAAARDVGIRPDQRCEFLFQAWDSPSETDRLSVSFERSVGNEKIKLVPDLYYFQSNGYRDLSTSVAASSLPWADRRAGFVWRGSTTGPFIAAGQVITPENFDALPRYRLCRIGKAIGDVFDAGIIDVVQTDTPATRATIEARLREEGLLLPYLPQERMGDFRFIVDIDGNSNSWGFLAKLLLGSCVVKVDSPYEQWFYRDLVPWEHYVPVASDMADLEKIVEWCLGHPEECARIAESGCAFASERHFERENHAAAYAVLAASAAI